jgi:hypothetical protein
MSNVGVVSGPSSPQILAPTGQSNAMLLSPDSLMYFCAIQLRALDGQITQRMAQQQSSRDAQQKLSKLQEFMGRYAGGIGKDDVWAKGEALKMYKEAFDLLPPGSELRNRLDASFHEFRKTACREDNCTFTSLADYTPEMKNDDLNHGSDEKNLVADWEMKPRMEELKNISNDVNKGAELEMTNLQTLISQRQMAVQLTTNLLSKVNETMHAIVNNTGK